MKSRITSYIKTNYGKEVFDEVMSGKRTVTFNDAVLTIDKKFPDRRVIETSKVEISEILVIETAPIIKNTMIVPIIEILEPINNIVEVPEIELITKIPDIVSEIPFVEVNTVEVPIVKTSIRIKRCYSTLRNGKTAPEGATVFTSDKGKQYYIKVIGEDRYITE